MNKSARVQGIGEKLEEIQNNLKVSLVVLKPPFGVSTAEAYKQVKSAKNLKKADIENIIEGLKNGNLPLVEKYIENNLEEALLKSDETLIEFKRRLAEIEELKFFMSGSGSAFYAFLTEDIDKRISKLKHRFNDCEIYLCNFK